MKDLRTQIRSYFEQIDPPFELSDLMRAPAPSTGRSTVGRSWPAPAFAFLAAFFLIIGVVAVLFLVRGHQGTESVDQPEPTVPSTTAPESLAPTTTHPTTTYTQATTTTIARSHRDDSQTLAAARIFYAALNAGDLQSAFATVDVGYELQSRYELAVEGLGAQFVYDCSVLEDGVQCRETVWDELYGPVGLTATSTAGYELQDGKVFPTGESLFFDCLPDSGPIHEYLVDLRMWSAEAHPGLEKYWVWGKPMSDPLAVPCLIYPFENTEGAQQVAGIVPEFVAQSDTWSATAERPEPPPEVAETQFADGIVLRVYENQPSGDATIAAAFRDSDLLFTLTHSCLECLAGSLEMTREPGGVLTKLGWHSEVWQSGTSDWQIEITRLWPPDGPFAASDILWLTDYTGITRDTLTGFDPEPGDLFTLYDELTLTTFGENTDNFGLHPNCSGLDEENREEDITAVLVSFEDYWPKALTGWTIDHKTMTFEQVADPTTLTIGTCLEAEPRSTN